MNRPSTKPQSITQNNKSMASENVPRKPKIAISHTIRAIRLTYTITTVSLRSAMDLHLHLTDIMFVCTHIRYTSAHRTNIDQTIWLFIKILKPVAVLSFSRNSISWIVHPNVNGRFSLLLTISILENVLAVHEYSRRTSSIHEFQFSRGV